MDIFISTAYAQQPAQQPQADMLTGFVLPMLFVVAVFYFLIIRPQSKRAKEHKSMLSELSKGDEVTTSGGLLGKVVKIGENFVEIEIADKVSVHVQKHAIVNMMPKGTMKSPS